jgi:Undecaprenyl-phosphate glucose phosphotransferase
VYKNHEYFLSLYYRLSDILCLNLAFFLGVVLRFHDEASFSFLGSNYASLLLFINITWLFISSSQKIYALRNFSSKNRYIFAIITSIALQTLITIAFNGLIKTFYSRVFLLLTYISFSLLLLIGRRITYWLYKQKLSRKVALNSIVLFGEKSGLLEIEDFFEQSIFKDTQQIIHLKERDIPYEKLKKINTRNPISEIYLPFSQYSEEEIEKLSGFCDNNFIRLRLIFDWKRVGARKINVAKFNQTTILKVALTPLDDQYNALIKRAFDIAFSLLLLLFLFSWLFPLLAIAVKLSSKGPVFFKQKRSGLNNREFNCYKFRSMRVNAEADKVQATQNDPRITKVGAFLRKSSLDELPQFINVLKGDMSIVGPRPHMVKHTEEYSQLIGDFMNRHAIKPGITGLAQIKGFRGEIDDFQLLQNRVRFDRFYVNNWTLFFDIRIVLLTVLSMFKDHR